MLGRYQIAHHLYERVRFFQEAGRDVARQNLLMESIQH